MKEILYYGLGTNRGGIETYLYKIARHINRERYHLSFIDMTGAKNTPCFFHELQDLGCNFYKIPPRNMSIMQNKKELYQLFHNNHFDIFHYNINTLSYLLPVQIAIKAGCHVVVHSRSTGAPNMHSYTRVFHEWNKKKLSQMDVTRIAVSQQAGEWLFGKNDYSIYPNGVDTKEFIFSELKRAEIRAKLKCEDKTVIANVGAFVPAKNHLFMIQVFEEYLKTNPQAVLWLIGDGPGRRIIEELVKEKGLEDAVLFLGVRKDMRDLYAGMDLFWFPSKYEGFGNVVLEAECEGVPCLLSDCIPQETMIANNAFSFGLERPIEEWVTKMNEVLLAQKPCRELCYQEIAAKGASVEAEIKRLENLYENIIK